MSNNRESLEVAMKQVSLAPFFVRIRRKRARSDEYLPIDAFDGVTSLFDLVRGALEEGQGRTSVDEARKHALRIDALSADPATRRLHGHTQAGEYGVGSVLMDVATLAEVRRSTTQADLVPHYFLFDLATDATEGFMMLQRFGQSSITRPMQSLLRSYVNEHHRGYSLTFESCMPDTVFEEMLRSNRVNAVRLVKNQVSADTVDSRLPRTETGRLELRYSKQGGLPPQLVSIFRRLPWANRYSMQRGLVRVSDQLEGIADYDTVKIEVSVGGRTKTIDLGNANRLRPSIDVSEDDVPPDANELPNLERLHAVAVQELEDLIQIHRG